MCVEWSALVPVIIHWNIRIKKRNNKNKKREIIRIKKRNNKNKKREIIRNIRRFTKKEENEWKEQKKWK